MPLRVREKENDFSPEAVRSVFSYDPLTGLLSWRKPPRRGVAAGPAGHRNADGYLIVGYRGHEYMGAHLIWVLMTGEWPGDGVDHENRRAFDDRWINLRSATYAQNNRNMGVRKDNRTGVRGVGINGRTGAFTARIRKDGKTTHLGDFRHLDEAAAVRATAEIKMFGEFSPLHTTRGA